VKNRLIKLALPLLTALLTACASGPAYKEVSRSLPPLSAEQGRIFFYRTTVAGAAVQPDVKLDGAVVGSAVPQGFFYADRDPGNCEVVTTTEVSNKLSFTLEKGQERFVRLDIRMGLFVGHIVPQLVDNSQALAEIQDTKFIGKQTVALAPAAAAPIAAVEPVQISAPEPAPVAAAPVVEPVALLATPVAEPAVTTVVAQTASTPTAPAPQAELAAAAPVEVAPVVADEPIAAIAAPAPTALAGTLLRGRPTLGTRDYETLRMTTAVRVVSTVRNKDGVWRYVAITGVGAGWLLADEVTMQ